MEPKVEPVGPPALVGEGPFWDDETQTLYYIDAFRPTIYSYHPGTRSHHSVNVDKPGKPEVHTTFVIKIKGEKNKFVISDDKRLAVINWDGVSSDPVMTEHLVDVEQEPAASFCDGKCDPSNRLWAGTKGPVPLDIPITEMEKEKGSLYSLQRDKTVKMHLSKITLSNGLIWSPDKKKFYYIDSLKFGIDSYDYDDTTGSIWMTPLTLTNLMDNATEQLNMCNIKKPAVTSDEVVIPLKEPIASPLKVYKGPPITAKKLVDKESFEDFFNRNIEEALKNSSKSTYSFSRDNKCSVTEGSKDNFLEFGELTKAKMKEMN
ncbi:hypothetical protein J6590_094819 [Homalodisca vitripennis]|nr:hypothetical protein J6590_094819 [Homalodisca vitripennis]